LVYLILWLYNLALVKYIGIGAKPNPGNGTVQL